MAAIIKLHERQDPPTCWYGKHFKFRSTHELKVRDDKDIARKQ